MSTGRRIALDHQVREIKASTALAGLVYELLKRWERGDYSDRDLAVAYIAAAQVAHAGSVRRAIEMIEELRTLEAPDRIHAAPVADPFDSGAAYGRAVGVMQDAAALDAAAPAYRSQLDHLFQAAAVTAQRHALMAGRRTVERSTAANGTTWRRVTDGNPCAFCAMLATRADYTSRDAALKIQGRRGRARGRRALGGSYHDRCGCTAVEVLDTWKATPQEEAYRRLYTQARDACSQNGVPPTTENILSRMRRNGQGVINDAAPNTEAGKSGGGNDDPPKPPLRSDAPSPRPRREIRTPRERTGADAAEWQARQEALPFDTRGTDMKPHEIEFAEQFIADGHKIRRWLPQGEKKNGRIMPQSDFEWVDGKLVELKRSDNAGTIKAYIKRNLAKGKRVFMVDFGDRPPSPRVLRNLSKFTPESGIPFELWAFWNGNLTQVL